VFSQPWLKNIFLKYESVEMAMFISPTQFVIVISFNPMASFDDLWLSCDFWHINHMTTSGRNATVL
jgi:hypothetical protein